MIHYLPCLPIERCEDVPVVPVVEVVVLWQVVLLQPGVDAHPGGQRALQPGLGVPGEGGRDRAGEGP